MRFFYQEQLHRMECISQEVVSFEDVLCQLSDLVTPEVEGRFTLRDIRRCAEPDVFFNALTNLNKLIAYEQRDPFQMRADAQLGLTAWERFVRVEYDAMAADEAEEEGGWGEEGYDDAAGALEAPF
jgi:serine/threonine-protein phosphatase 2A regulatory subunit B''